ncbi:unnamed protein product, partial [marine sediment metagenome]
GGHEILSGEGMILDATGIILGASGSGMILGKPGSQKAGRDPNFL